MNKLLCEFQIIRAYIDDLLIITRGDWSDQLNKLELVLKKLKDKGLKCNTKN